MNLKDAIARAAKRGKAPGGLPYRGISIGAVKKIAARYRKSLRFVEISALKQDIIPLRYLRNIGTIGPEGQAKLLDSHIVIIGAGGLGGTVLEILARYGVGKICIVDYDAFEESNLNRQILCSTRNLKNKKSKEAVKRVQFINPAIEIKGFAKKLTKNNAASIIKEADIVADCVDGLRERFIIEQAAKKKKIPLVHAAVSGFEGQLTTIFPEDEGLKQLYGSLKDVPERGCETLAGTPPTTVIHMAALQAQEVIKVLLRMNNTLHKKLLLIDLKTSNIKHLRMKPRLQKDLP